MIASVEPPLSQPHSSGTLARIDAGAKSSFGIFVHYCARHRHYRRNCRVPRPCRSRSARAGTKTSGHRRNHSPSLTSTPPCPTDAPASSTAAAGTPSSSTAPRYAPPASTRTRRGLRTTRSTPCRRPPQRTTARMLAQGGGKKRGGSTGTRKVREGKARALMWTKPGGRRGCFGRVLCGSWRVPSPLRRSR